MHDECEDLNFGRFCNLSYIESKGTLLFIKINKCKYIYKDYYKDIHLLTKGYFIYLRTFIISILWAYLLFVVGLVNTLNANAEVALYLSVYLNM